MSTDTLIEALGATAEVMGQQVTPAALLLMADDLSEYAPAAVLEALRRVRRECRRMTLSDIAERLAEADSRPAADEAWMNALTAQDECATVVWTEEASEAFQIARPALEANDRIGARMAFKAAYDRLVAQAREARRPAKWITSLGWDAQQRRQVLERAARQGLLPAAQVSALLPPPESDDGELPPALRLASSKPSNGSMPRARGHLAHIRQLLGDRTNHLKPEEEKAWPA